MKVIQRAGLATMFFVAGASFASADWISDVESARGNARAGGPTNGHDAELLDRHGCLSGTRSRFCEARRYANERGFRTRRGQR
jgi:hypothetical protein